MTTARTGAAAAAGAATPQVARDRLAIFSAGWALAALFHVAGNPRPSFLSDLQGDAAFVVVQVAVAVTAVAVLWRPRDQRRLAALCVLIAVSAWLEAPFVGNHWVLAAAISLTFLTAVVWRRVPVRRVDPSGVRPHTGAAFAPAARLVLVIAYSFAAFAKLNTSFFDPAVSCAVYYHDQLVGSWGLHALTVGGRPGLGLAIAVAAAAIELSIVPLLTVRRTRRAGLLLGLAFHWLLAMDLAQHFWDFSAVLFSAFLLFLDDDQVARVVVTSRTLLERVRPRVRTLTAGIGLLGAAVVAAGAAVPAQEHLRTPNLLVGHLAWWLLGTTALGVVALATARTRSTPRPGVFRVSALPLLLVPLLVLFNGVTPYLELKTGFGWNMYSNLRTVAGETNHLLVPATIDLTGLQRDRVEILAASDPLLARLIGSGYALAYSELREYARIQPDASVTYRRGGAIHEADPIAGDAAAGGDVSVISWRLQSFRAIDTTDAERCQPVFTPAR